MSQAVQQCIFDVDSSAPPKRLARTTEPELTAPTRAGTLNSARVAHVPRLSWLGDVCSSSSMGRAFRVESNNRNGHSHCSDRHSRQQLRLNSYDLNSAVISTILYPHRGQKPHEALLAALFTFTHNRDISGTCRPLHPTSSSAQDREPPACSLVLGSVSETWVKVLRASLHRTRPLLIC